MNMKRTTISQKIILIAIVILGFNCTSSNDSPVYKDESKSIDVRVDDLIARMTIEEKASQLMYTSPAIERLGIPEYNWWNECLHGVARAGLATVFPQAIGMAATFDTDLIQQMGVVVSDEARAKHHDAVKRGKRGIYQGLNFWTPNINIFRDPRWGRGMETYGEDPFLTSEIAISYINGLQGNDSKYLKTMATAKHFVVHSGPESTRHSFNAVVDDRDLYDTYLPHFKRTIQEANVQAVMCAYNRLDGEACCGSGALLNDLLRNEWGFKGHVVSDCWALVDFYDGHFVSKDEKEASALALASGTDLNCGKVYHSLMDAFKDSLLTEADVDIALKRLFTARFQLGLFDSEENQEYAKIPISVVASEEHAKLSLETARKSMVLLKNEGSLLPLSKENKTIAVIGPNADDSEVLLGNYNGFAENPITPLQGIKDKVGENTEVLFARGCDWADGLPHMVPVPAKYLFTDKDKKVTGLKAEFFNNDKFEGESVKDSVHENIDFNWWENAPITEVEDDNFGVRWTGFLIPEKSGKYYLGGEGANGFKIFLDGEKIVDHYDQHTVQKRYKDIELEAGKVYEVKIEFVNKERMAMMKFIWAPPVDNLKEEALEIAQKADEIILFMGLSPRLEGEEMSVEVEGFHGGDRKILSLPKVQLELMKALKKLNKPMILVLLNGSAVAINWENENIPAILEAWYPGQEAGRAIADILFGDYNPAGRLPVTFYKSVNDIPAFDDYAMEGRTYRYFKGEPLFEFGYGLSYTKFDYSDLKLDQPEIKKDGSAIVSINLTNSGDYDGEEVVQLYIKQLKSKVKRPLKDLRGIQRILLKKGESKVVNFEIKASMLAYITKDKEVIEAGDYEIMIGGSSSDKNLVKATLKVIE